MRSGHHGVVVQDAELRRRDRPPAPQGDRVFVRSSTRSAKTFRYCGEVDHVKQAFAACGHGSARDIVVFVERSRKSGYGVITKHGVARPDRDTAVCSR